MAIPADRLPQNVPGPYYVDAQCIDCYFLPRNCAHDFRDAMRKAAFHFVQRQPLTPEEIALTEEARQGCPVEAIGNADDATP